MQLVRWRRLPDLAEPPQMLSIGLDPTSEILARARMLSPLSQAFAQFVNKRDRDERGREKKIGEGDIPECLPLVLSLVRQRSGTGAGGKDCPTMVSP